MLALMLDGWECDKLECKSDTILMVNTIFLGILSLSMVLTSCSRSSSYKQEQDYYRQDTEYSNRQGIATAKVERLGQPKRKIFILPFMNDTPLSGDSLGIFASDELLREVKNLGKSIVPDDLRTASQSKDFYSGNKIRLSPLIREGRKLGVGLIVIGKIKKVTYRKKGDSVGLLRQKRSIAAVDMEMRLFDCSEGKEVFLDEKSADSSSSQLNIFGGEEEETKSARIELVQQAIRNASRIFSQDLSRALDKINWIGRIAKISGSRIFVNAGRASGLNIGDILKVLTPGEDVYDPVTGAYMGKSSGQPKGTLEVADYFGIDGAVTVVHSGGGFVENDIVQLY